MMMDKILALGENGIELLGTKMLRCIKGIEGAFCELRGGQCRIALYFNRGRSEFVLLHGFLKKKQNEKAEIKRARGLLQEYLR